MSKPDAQRAFNIYKRFVQQTEQDTFPIGGTTFREHYMSSTEDQVCSTTTQTKAGSQAEMEFVDVEIRVENCLFLSLFRLLSWVLDAPSSLFFLWFQG
jgi:hypothetical protein